MILLSTTWARRRIWRGRLGGGSWAGSHRRLPQRCARGRLGRHRCNLRFIGVIYTLLVLLNTSSFYCLIPAPAANTTACSFSCLQGYLVLPVPVSYLCFIHFSVTRRMKKYQWWMSFVRFRHHCVLFSSIDSISLRHLLNPLFRQQQRNHRGLFSPPTGSRFDIVTPWRYTTTKPTAWFLGRGLIGCPRI